MFITSTPSFLTRLSQFSIETPLSSLNFCNKFFVTLHNGCPSINTSIFCMRGVLIEVLKEIIIKQAGNLQKFLGIKGVFLDKPTYLCRGYF